MVWMFLFGFLSGAATVVVVSALIANGGDDEPWLSDFGPRL